MKNKLVLIIMLLMVFIIGTNVLATEAEGSPMNIEYNHGQFIINKKDVIDLNSGVKNVLAKFENACFSSSRSTYGWMSNTITTNLYQFKNFPVRIVTNVRVKSNFVYNTLDNLRSFKPGSLDTIEFSFEDRNFKTRLFIKGLTADAELTPEQLEVFFNNTRTRYKKSTYNDAVSRNINFINNSVKWIVGHFNISHSTSLLDLGCGPGLYTSRLAKTGTKVTGIDFSSHSLDYAKKEALKEKLDINYICANYLEYNPDEKYDLIIMIMCDFSILSPVQRGQLLTKCSNLLKPNGSILLDVYSLNYLHEIQAFASYELNQLNKFWSPHDYYCFVNRFKYELEQLILDKYTIIEADSKRTVYNWYQCFSKEAIEIEFAKNGLKVTEFFSDVAGKSFDINSNEFAVVAKKE